MKFLLNSNDDWIEQFRRNWYPQLHPYLKQFGGYGIGYVTPAQYATTVKIPAEKLEEELVDIGFKRNPIAAFKHLEGEPTRKSIGSWRLLPESDPNNKIDDKKQLHVTLIPSETDDGTVDIYAHHEYNWEKAPLKHLASKGLEAAWAASYMRELVSKEMFIENFDKGN